MECYVADNYWDDGYTEQDVCGITPTSPRGDDGAFRSHGQREKFWQDRAEKALEELLDRAERVIRRPVKARQDVADDFALIEWEYLPVAPKTREMLAEIIAPQPDYTALAALIMAQREAIERDRRIRRRRRDEAALIALMG